MALFYVLSLSFFLSLQAQLKSTMANIELNSSITTNEDSVWTSESGDFAFGFHQPDNSSLYLLGIWFNKIPERNIVWYANGDDLAPQGSKVELTESSLVLLDPEGRKIWEAKPSRKVSHATMLDTGNLVLAGYTSTYLWESFDSLTDTILPTVKLDSGSKLFSRLTETNFSMGRFELQFLNGNLQLRAVAWPSRFQYAPYYNSPTADPAQSGYQLVFNGSGSIYIDKGNGETVQVPGWNPVGNNSAGYYYRATLDFDGVFTHYSHPKNSTASQGWISLQFVPGNICTDMTEDIGSGPCGFNSICSFQDGKPTCDCPYGYVFVDPNNRHGGCKPAFPQGCGLDDESSSPEELYHFQEVDNVNWPLGDYERLPYNRTDCEKSCLYDCSCAVAVLSPDNCWKKRMPLSNGRSEEGSKVLLKIRKEAPPPPPGFSHLCGNKEASVLLKALLSGSAFVSACFATLSLILFLRRHKTKVAKSAPNSSNYETNQLRSFSYQDIETATNGFMEELGRGSFGIVYKGILSSGSIRVPVAVKKFDKLVQERQKEWKAEVDAIGKTHHKNLVRLLGYCDEGCHRLLVYEFMSNGTLANFLFTAPKPDWHHRISIALEIARGLVYLHEECNVPIIHCDIKPQNILLDDNLRARISDFGLAKLLLSDQTRTRTMIRGTRGYVAPEWFKNVPITTKVDVYSFGVMLLEIICCRASVEVEAEAEERAILTDWACDCYAEGRFDLLVNDDKEAMDDKDWLKRLASIAIWCIQEDPSTRPSAKMVVAILEGFAEVPLPITIPLSFSATSQRDSIGD